MATNQLLPFATAEGANVIPYTEWQALTTILNNGFQSGIASSQQINRILAQGGVAGYVMGEIVKQYQNADATLDPDSLYTNFVAALISIISANSVNAAALKAAFPVGSYLLYAGKVCPSGFLPCNGGAISRTTYAELFTAIGTTYGAGDGSTTFNLPNQDGRVLQGTNDLSKVGQYLAASLPNIRGLLYAQAVGQNRSNIFVHASSAFSTRTDGDTGSGSISFDYSTGGKTLSYLDFDSSRVSSLYRGTTLRVPACQCLVAIRF